MAESKRKDTSKMTSRELYDYLSSQKDKGWPGSVSIHGKELVVDKRKS